MASAENTGTVADQWRSNKRLAAMWDKGVKNKGVSLVYSAIVFGTDNRKMYQHMAALSRLPEGTSVLDVPSGGGILFHTLRPGSKLKYTAADISQLMLDRARDEAAKRGLHDLEFREADAEAMPFDDHSFDVVASYSGLHCMPHPEVAVREMFRVLRPGGRLLGSSAIRGANPVSDRFINLWVKRRILDVTVPGPTFVGWLRDAGFTDLKISRSGAILYFEGTRPELAEKPERGEE
ncbi:methyltransferase domain-containing protein [Solihabitans fulvus]|uniref:Methyltransferase domain-containing protein n=1 Tax=Solihabitans fulvus TaxID=1892852 RepID=A0A5B2WHM3_9PSEU|nr:methyltransferase domain-containing protein [Solihabitans fulvus]KAA2250152.1 methyltransferase domain-containing protein [Solihabitans fulvus]